MASIYIQSNIHSPPNALLYLINQMRGSQLYFEQMNNVFFQDNYIWWTTKKYKYKDWIQGWWLRETLKMIFIRLMGNNEKAPTRKYHLENVLLKLIILDQNISGFLTWLNTEVKMHKEKRQRLQNAKLFYFKSKQNRLTIFMEKMHET